MGSTTKAISGHRPGPARTSVGAELLRRFRDVPFTTRAFLKARWYYTPYEAIAARLPSHGLILDLGSGHGLLALTLALTGSKRQVRGIDHDATRVALAQRVSRDVENLHFETGSLQEALLSCRWVSRASAIVILDTLHYLSAEEQEAVLAAAFQALAPHGDLVLREVDATKGITFRINRLHERLMTGLGFTRGERLMFRAPAEWEALARRCGFEVTSEPCSRFPFADRLFLCRKGSGPSPLQNGPSPASC